MDSVGTISFATPVSTTPCSSSSTSTEPSNFVDFANSVASQDTLPTSQEPITPRNVSIWIQDTPRAIDAGDPNSEEISYELTFMVTCYNEAQPGEIQKTQSGTVKRIIKISKDALANEMMATQAATKTITVEDKKSPVVVEEEQNKLSQRIRELAGISGKGTWV